ncbi:MAG: cyclic nucleotide-binding domain-containing protein, partial [Calditrichaeota bacterium]|nr:cyclic nucleotide-binding domain-containing protein [Calditrichota bacterium]
MDYDLLRKIPLFGDLTDEELDLVSKLIMHREYSKNTLVIFEDDVGNCLFVIKYGRVKISRIASDGSEAILAILGT